MEKRNSGASQDLYMAFVMWVLSLGLWKEDQEYELAYIRTIPFIETVVILGSSRPPFYAHVACILLSKMLVFRPYTRKQKAERIRPKQISHGPSRLREKERGREEGEGPGNPLNP